MSFSTLPDYDARRMMVSEQSGRVAASQSSAPLPRPIRALVVHSGNLYGGVERTLLAQARYHYLCPELEQSFALCFAGRFSEELVKTKAEIHWLGNVRTSRPLSVRRARRQLRELLSRERFDLVVTESAWSQAIFAPVARACRLPQVLRLHGAASGRHWLERWASRTRPDLVICNSQFTASTLPNLFRATATEVIFPPLLSPTAEEVNAESSLIRRELETPDTAVVIIQVGRMEAGKGQAEHLRALALLKDVPDWICWQVGGAQRPEEAAYVESLKRLARESGIAGRVRFLGQRADVASLLSAADIFCHPNTTPEGFGLAFVEALKSGLPVVTAAVGGAMEIIDDSCGIFVLPGDATSLAAALRRLIHDQALRQLLGAAGPTRALKLCDIETGLRRLHKAFVSLCK